MTLAALGLSVSPSEAMKRPRGRSDGECTAQSHLEEHRGEREGAYWDILFKDVICAKQGEENRSARAWGGVHRILHLCWQREERDAWNIRLVPEHRSPSGPILLLVKGSCSFQHPRTKDSAGPYWPGASFSQLVSPSSQSTPLLLFQKWEKCP